MALLLALTAGGAPAGVTIDCNVGTASASGYAATVSQAATINTNLGQATAYGNQASISTGGSIDVKVAWLQFNTQATPCDVKVSWLQFDTNSTPCDVKVSWLEFNSSAGAANDSEWVIRARRRRHR
jgi:hypothetical protein